ncbi:hypothetical protein CCMSSC00406_0007812 [Pleurotus cornucopiae]|uniref:Uncharacterized protein n=1 Tax=Pleurotus cornucopiae TaxID=5321 RepID=A0ACB7J5E7_PLECO|nr:hypothetical protein CCMSSC00406_0007812 [Pleurotus cornucopiae]
MNSSKRALSAVQERRLVDHLDQQFLELTRGYKKRSEPTTHLPTLSSYLAAAQKILILILQIPPIDPSTSLRTALLLRLTNEVLSSIPGYPPDRDALQEVLDWLDDLDQAWVAALQSQVWDPAQAAGVDLVVDASDAAAGMKSSPMSQTERTRLRSLLVGASASLEEWLATTNEEGSTMDLEVLLERMGLQEGFDEMFSNTLHELGALGGSIVDPNGMVGTC